MADIGNNDNFQVPERLHIAFVAFREKGDDRQQMGGLLIKPNQEEHEKSKENLRRICSEKGLVETDIISENLEENTFVVIELIEDAKVVEKNLIFCEVYDNYLKVQEEEEQDSGVEEAEVVAN